MTDRAEATNRLFRNLADLEHLAVLMCLKHEAVEGQLADEKRHYYAFAELSRPLQPALPPIQALTDWVATLENAAAVAVLNIVAEVWVEEILLTLATHGPKEHETLFLEVAADERRHCHGVQPPLEEAAPYVRILEQHLHAIASHPGFMYPLVHLLGTSETVRLAQRLHENHEAACERLQAAPGEHFKALVACRVQASDDRGVTGLLELDHWRRSAFNMELAPMTGFRRIPWEWEEDPALIESRFVRATHRVLKTYPHLNRTINPAREEIYQPLSTVVGTRRLGKPGIVTCYSVDAAARALMVLHRQTRAQARQARAAAVEIPKISHALLRLQPPPRAAAVVTSLQGLGGIHYGLAPISPIEGAVWSVGVPGAIDQDGYITVGVLADHRAVDGADLCTFLDALHSYLGD